MRSSLQFAAALCFAVVGLTGVANAAEMVDNPAYVSWSKSKPGTSVTYKMISETKMEGMPAPMKSEMTMTQTLKEVKPDAVTVEVTTKMSMNGQEMNMPPRNQDIPAKIEKGKEGMSPDVKGEISDVKTGKETIEVNGKKYDTETREFKMKMTEPAEMTGETKVWTSSQIPGGMVKTQSKTTTPIASTSTITLESFTQK
jgi:hypothetical protein